MRGSLIVFLAIYYSGDQIEKNEMAEHVARMVKRRDAYRILVGKPERSRSLERPRRRWKDNIKMDVYETG
jgi:hypothetical protein